MLTIIRKILEPLAPFAAVCLLVLLGISEFQNYRLRSALEGMREAVIQQEKDHAKKLATATNSITLAAAEYDSVRAERDALSRKLLRAAGAAGAGDTLGACQARNSRLESMVGELHSLVEACDSGWHGCASRKDALSEVVR